MLALRSVASGGNDAGLEAARKDAGALCDKIVAEINAVLNAAK